MNESSIQLISNIEEKMIEIECDERKMRGSFSICHKKMLWRQWSKVAH